MWWFDHMISDVCVMIDISYILRPWQRGRLLRVWGVCSRFVGCRWHSAPVLAPRTASSPLPCRRASVKTPPLWWHSAASANKQQPQPIDIKTGILRPTVDSFRIIIHHNLHQHFKLKLGTVMDLACEIISLKHKFIENKQLILTPDIWVLKHSVTYHDETSALLF